MNNIVPISQARMPAAMRSRMQAGVGVNKNFETGVRDAFPILSIKGKVFRLRVDGREEPLIDRQTNQVIPYLDVILVNGSEFISKAYYIKGFDDDNFTPPDCWSLDSVRPDPSVANKVSPTCAMCPKNAFGSAPARDGQEGKRGGKACADARRIAVTFHGHLGQPDRPPMMFLLRVPATSLKTLKAYAQMLERQGWDTAACVTRLAFDYNEAYPKLLFNFVDGLNDVEYDEVVKLAESPTVADMLRAPDFDTTVPVNPTPNASLDPRVRQEAPIVQDPSILANVPGQDWQVQQGQQTSVPPTREPMQRPQPATQQAQPAAQQTEPAAQQQAPAMTVADDPVIELPDGQLFNSVTGEFITRSQPKVEMPSIDPNTLPLPDGRFYNKVTGKFVTGPEVGAPQVTDTPPTDKPAKKPAPKKAPAKPSPAAEAKPAEAKTSPAPEVAASAPPNGTPVASTVTVNGPAPATPAGIQSASAALEDMLKSVLPKR